MKLPAALHPLFWDFRPESIDTDLHAPLVLERVIEYGTLTSVRWAREAYGADRIREFLRSRGYDVSEAGRIVYVLAIDGSRRVRRGRKSCKTVTVRDLQKKVKQCVDDVQQDRVLVMRRGKPAAVLVGVEGADWDAEVLETDPSFWRMVRARRKQATLSLEQLRRRLQASR